MTLKMIDVDDKKWKLFGRWCAIHDTTMKKQIGKFLDRFGKEDTR